MAKKTTTRKKKTTKPARASRYGWCEEEILLSVIAPKIHDAIGSGATSKPQLLEYLRKEHGCTAGPSTLNYWMSKLGLKSQTKTVFALADDSILLEKMLDDSETEEEPATPPTEEDVLTEELPPEVRSTTPEGGTVGGPSGPHRPQLKQGVGGLANPLGI